MSDIPEAMNLRRAIVIALTIVFVVAVLLVAMLFSNARPIYWTEGPITIEQQIVPRPFPVTRIAYIDAMGNAYRDGVPVEALPEEDVRELVRDLLDYYRTLSWPPYESKTPKRKAPRIMEGAK